MEVVEREQEKVHEQERRMVRKQLPGRFEGTGQGMGQTELVAENKNVAATAAVAVDDAVVILAEKVLIAEQCNNKLGYNWDSTVESIFQGNFLARKTDFFTRHGVGKTLRGTG